MVFLNERLRLESKRHAMARRAAEQSYCLVSALAKVRYGCADEERYTTSSANASKRNGIDRESSGRHHPLAS